MKHLLFFLDYYLPHRGGVETVFEQIITRLVAKGYHITLVTSRFDSRLSLCEKASHMQIHRVGGGRLSYIILSFLLGFRLLKKGNIDTIHASTYGGAFPALLLGKLFKKRVILTVHEVFGRLWFHYKGYLGFLYLLAERALFIFPASVYHCVSYYTMNSLRLLYGIPDDRLLVIPNGVDTDFWNPSQVSDFEIQDWKSDHFWQGRFVVLYYGHAGISKGIDTLIDAIPQIVPHFPEILFVCNVIDSKRTPKILRRLRDLETVGYARQIQIFEGMSKEELRVLVASADAVVAPSLSEGFGSVHTEVAAMGKPLITSAVASLPEVVSGKVLFVRPGQSQELVSAIVSLYKNQHIVEDMPVRVFDWNATVEALERLY